MCLQECDIWLFLERKKGTFWFGTVNDNELNFNFKMPTDLGLTSATGNWDLGSRLGSLSQI